MARNLSTKMLDLYVKLNNGTRMPAIGYGSAIIPSKNQEEHSTRATKTLEIALETGYRQIDTSRVYGTERCIGNAVHKKIKEGLINREDVFIITKLWCNRFQRHEVLPALQDSLKDLGMNYADLYLIHWPTPFKSSDDMWPPAQQYSNTDNLETWRGMEECYKHGLTKAIGVSNFNSKQLTRILDNCKVKPANNQIECHPFLSNNKLVEFCQKHDIAVTAYTPLCGIRDYVTDPNPPSIFTDPVIKQVAQKNNKTPAQVTLRYLIQRNISVIPTSQNPKRMKENLQIFDFELSDDDMVLMATCNKDFRTCTLFNDHPNYPYNEEF